jgi:isochorismate synthase
MNISVSVSPKEITETELFTFLINYAAQHSLPLAIWRLPDDSASHAIISLTPTWLKKDVVLEELSPGFIFAPFDREKESIFLPADYLFTIQNGVLQTPQNEKEIQSKAWLDAHWKKTVDTTHPIVNDINPVSENNNTPLHYCALVNQCIAEIEKGTFEKIVPSRIKIIDLPETFEVVNAFQKLCHYYTHGLISFVSIPTVGRWLGASPEILVCVENKTIFKTVALAGTKPYHEGINVKSVAWTQKEIEEQALVERYVISCFKKIRLREYDEHGPKTVVAGNLMHLKSDFTVDMKATNFPQLGTIMLQLLHPTSAVCGMPLEPSLQFLKRYEGYDRSFYAGYLGPVNVKNNINIFVNLRCMRLLERQAVLYAGAGVTVDSVPEQELEETELKFNTLLNIIL